MRKLGWLAAAGLLAACSAPTPTVPVQPDASRQVLAIRTPALAVTVLSAQAYQMLIHQASLAEITAGQLALQKSGTPGVKAFAQTLINDHSKSEAQVRALAAGRGRVLANALPPDMSREVMTLQRLSGPAFDRAFIAFNIAGHQKAIAATRAQALRGSDPATRLLAVQNLPVLEKHLRMAESLAKKR